MPGGAARTLAVLALVPALAQAQAPALPPLVNSSATAVGAGWQVRGLPRQKVPLTEFAATRVDGMPALRIEARGSYGNLTYMLRDGAPAPRSLSWSWRLDHPNLFADLRTKEGDDSAARVCISFDLPLERIPFLERQRLELARAVSGEALPAATLCWVWDTHEAAGTVIANAYSRRVRYLVVRGGNDLFGRWADEARDIAADFARVFGDESPVLPPARAVIVGADADNTRTTSVAYVADLRLR